MRGSKMLCAHCGARNVAWVIPAGPGRAGRRAAIPVAGGTGCVAGEQLVH